MADDAGGFDCGHIRVLELPGPITSLQKFGGRVLARLEDGREVDLTDWFVENHDSPN